MKTVSSEEIFLGIFLPSLASSGILYHLTPTRPQSLSPLQVLRATLPKELLQATDIIRVKENLTPTLPRVQTG